MDLPWHPDLASAPLTSCSLRSCPTTALPSLPWSALGRIEALHNSRGHYCKLWNVLHQPFPRTQEGSKQAFCQTARLPWASPLGWKGSGRIGMGQLKAPILRDVWPTTVGPALRHDGGHTLDSFKPGATRAPAWRPRGPLGLAGARCQPLFSCRPQQSLWSQDSTAP